MARRLRTIIWLLPLVEIAALFALPLFSYGGLSAAIATLLIVVVLGLWLAISGIRGRLTSFRLAVEDVGCALLSTFAVRMVVCL